MVYAVYVVIGLSAGAASALLGIGGGVILTPVLILLFQLPAKTATATSLGYIAPIALTGLLVAWQRGDAPRWGLVALAVPGGMIGAYLGRWASSHMSSGHIKVLFAIVMLIVGVQLGLDGWRNLRAAPPATEPAVQEQR